MNRTSAGIAATTKPAPVTNAPAAPVKTSFTIIHRDADGNVITTYHQQPANPFAPVDHNEALILVRASEMSNPVRRAMKKSAEELYPKHVVTTLPASVRQVEIRASKGGVPLVYDIVFLEGRTTTFDSPALGKNVEVELIDSNPWKPKHYYVVYLDADLDRILTEDELQTEGDAVAKKFGAASYAKTSAGERTGRLMRSREIVLFPYNVRFAQAKPHVEHKPKHAAQIKKKAGRRS